MQGRNQVICLGLHRPRDRADSRLALSQWETSLQSNAISHWLGANLESALKKATILQTITWRAFSWKKTSEFYQNCPCFYGIFLITKQHWFRSRLDTEQATNHYLNLKPVMTKIYTDLLRSLWWPSSQAQTWPWGGFHELMLLVNTSKFLFKTCSFYAFVAQRSFSISHQNLHKQISGAHIINYVYQIAVKGNWGKPCHGPYMPCMWNCSEHKQLIHHD